MTKPNPMTTTLTETEIDLLIQKIIDDTGDVPSAEKWIRNKVHSIHHDIAMEGLTLENTQRRDEWSLVQRYFERNRFAISRMAKINQ
jgi:hypothetical protein